MLAGSYSYVAVGATAQTYDALAKPVHRRVLFAGEHTCKVTPPPFPKSHQAELCVHHSALQEPGINVVGLDGM